MQIKIGTMHCAAVEKRRRIRGTDVSRYRYECMGGARQRGGHGGEGGGVRRYAGHDEINSMLIHDYRVNLMQT